MNRALDWLAEAEAEFDTARDLMKIGRHAWCCFTCQQAAEKALKAALEHLRDPTMGHDLLDLLGRLGQHAAVAQSIQDACARLNRYYIPTRYPDAFSSGAPASKYFSSDAQQAVADAEEVLRFVKTLVP